MVKARLRFLTDHQNTFSDIGNTLQVSLLHGKITTNARISVSEVANTFYISHTFTFLITSAFLVKTNK